MSSHCLYRVYDAAGRLLYIGRTADLTIRLRGHKSVQPWWSEVDRVDATPMASPEEAFAAERLAIKAERPLYNVQLAKPRQAIVNFRAPADVKARALARAEREGINLTDALREFLTEWAAEE